MKVLISKLIRPSAAMVGATLVIFLGEAGIAGDRSPGGPAVPFRGTVLEKLMGGDKRTTGTQVPVRPSTRAGWQAPAAKGDAPKTELAAPAAPVPEPGAQPTPTGEQEAVEVPPTEESSASIPKDVAAEPDEADAKADAATLLNKARGLVAKRAFKEALAIFNLALKKAEKKGNEPVMAGSLSGMARACRGMERNGDALAHLRRSIRAYKNLKNARARSLDYLLAGRILMDRHRYLHALKAFEESFKILPNSEAKERPRLLEDMAVCKLRLNHYSESLATYNRLLALLNKTGDELEAARVQVIIGDMHVARSDYKTARSAFRRAEQTYRKAKKAADVAQTLYRIAYLDQLSGDFKSAQKAIKEGTALLSREGSPQIDALPLMVRGLEAFNQGRIIVAAKSLRASLNQYHKQGDRVMAARVKLALAKVESARSRMRAALQLGGSALEEFRRLSDLGGECGALQLVGEVYYCQGYIHKALEYAQESLAIAKRINDHTEAVRSRILLAEIHATLGDTDFAWKLLKEAHQVSGSHVDHRTGGRLYLAIASFRLNRLDSDRALEAVNYARRHFAAINDRRGMADCDNFAGRVVEIQGKREESRKLLSQALKEHRAMWDRLGEGKDLTALGVYYKNSGDYDAAMEHFRKALDLREGIGDRRGAAANLANIGNLLKHRDKIPEALEKLQQAFDVYSELSDKKGKADLLTNLGNVHAAGGAHTLALEKLRAALEAHREIQDFRGAATDLASMGKIYQVRGDLDNAEHYLGEAAKLNARIDNPRGETAVLAESAMLQRARKNPQQALALLKKALEIAQKTNDPRSASSIRLKMALVMEDAGEYEKAYSLLESTLKIMRKQDDQRGELWALGEMGVLRVKMGDYENALSHLHDAIALRSKLGIPHSQSRNLDFHLGRIYEGFRNFELALEHYHRALALAQVSAGDTLLGQIYDSIGNIYYQIEQYDKAKEFLEDALRVHSETRNVNMQQTELIRLGDILSKLGKSEAAVQHQLKALKLAQQSGDSRTEARILTRLGTLNQILGRPGTALHYYRNARDIRTQLGDRRGVNENLLQIALVTSILGKFDDAVPELKRAFEIAQCTEDRSMLWKAYFIMGRTLQGKRRLGEALESYRKAITILEAMEADIVEESDEDNFIFGGKKALFETTLSVLMRLARKDPEGAYDNQALAIVEKLKAAAFENTLAGMHVPAFADVPKDLMIRENSLKLVLQKLTTSLTNELSRVNPDQKKIRKLLEERRSKEKSFRSLKKRLMKEYPAYASLKYPPPVSVRRLQKYIIDPDEAILEYMVTRSKTYLFAIDKTRFHTYSVDYSLNELERDVAAVTRPFYRSDALANWDPSAAYRLYARIVKPVEHFLAGKKTAVIIPDGPLNSLPFEILVTSKSHERKRFWSPTNRPRYLLERYALCYVPSCSVLTSVRTRDRKREPGWTLAGFGDPLYDNSNGKQSLNPGAERLLASLSNDRPTGNGASLLPPLPGSRLEISEISKIVGGPVQTYFGTQATETLFKKADLGRYSYIHLATHGVLLGGSGRLWRQPAIVFSLYGDRENDGFLQLGEVFGLGLNADLVVLSSCLTPDRSQGCRVDPLQGLSRALLFSGSDSVILSMWPVNDQSAAKLFTEMYRRLKIGSKAEALRLAKLSLLKTEGHSHPYYWAPFVLNGKWQVGVAPTSAAVDLRKLRFKGLSAWRKLLSM